MICLGNIYIYNNNNNIKHFLHFNTINFHTQIYLQKPSSSKLIFHRNKYYLRRLIMEAKGEVVMLTSGASGRINALLSVQVLKSLLMLVNAFLLLLFYPFRGRKMRSPSSSSCVVVPEVVKGGVRVPVVVPWKSSANAAANVVAVVDQEVAVRRTLAIRKVTADNGGDVCRRDYSLFVTPRGDTMFTQSWTPISVKTRALVVLLHGLNEHSGRYDQFAKQLNAHGYKVYGMDWVGVEIFWMPIGAKARPVILGTISSIGHGGSDGLHAYVHSLEDAVTDAKAFIKHVMSENTGLPCFCFGHSTGGAIILKAALDPKIEKSLAGIVLTSPAVGVQPTHPIFLILAPIFSLLIPKYQLSAANKTEALVSRDPAALIAKYSDPLVYTGSIRVRTGNEILRITSYLQRNAHELKVPFFVLHGGSDTVTDPNASLKLYEEASSEDKSIKLLPECLHDLLFEPEQEDIKRDIIDWLNSRV